MPATKKSASQTRRQEENTKKPKKGDTSKKKVKPIKGGGFLTVRAVETAEGYHLEVESKNFSVGHMFQIMHQATIQLISDSEESSN